MILFLIIVLLFIIIFTICLWIDNKYKNFIDEHSILIARIKEVNKKYNFMDIERFLYTHNYDNEEYYRLINPSDYLTYQLVYDKNSVKKAIAATLENRNAYDLYKDDIDHINVSDQYDIEVPLKFRKLLAAKERKMAKAMILRPTIEFKIKVELNLTNINGRFIESKGANFGTSTIEDILYRLKDKQGDFYNDKKIWKSIEIVERGKVSNKLRFYIYNRDHYRCKKCGRKTDNLEIDHIVPISKGGKTTIDNLQTLCHDCNVNKSNTVEAGTGEKIYNTNGYCPLCGAALKLKIGKYGKFYGCMNYPNCKYTKNM